MKKEDIEFLKELQKRIKEGKRCGEAEPAFWMIEDRFCYGSSDPEGADETQLVNPEDGHVWADEDVEDVKDILWDAMDDLMLTYDLEECKTIKDVIRLMEYNDIDGDREGYLWLTYVQHYWKIIEETGAFLTYEDCQRHLDENRYNYSKDAHPYALTAWRNPTFERLWRIITETDWEKEDMRNGKNI